MTSFFPHQIPSLCDSRLSACPLGELSFSVREDLSVEAADSAIPPSCLFTFSGLSVQEVTGNCHILPRRGWKPGFKVTIHAACTNERLKVEPA